jgi:tetratricopeptide (TPR) repeat protein
LSDLPEAWQFYRLAREDPSAALEALQGDSSPLGRYNHFVLKPSPEAYLELQTLLPEAQGALLEAVAFQTGLCSSPPNPDQIGAGWFCGEVRAYLQTTYAAYLLEHRQLEPALFLLQSAAAEVEAISPAFAARLYAEWASIEAQQGRNSDQGLQYLRRAVQLYRQTEFGAALGELWLQLGIALQLHVQESRDKQLLLQAVNAYQEATQLLHPEQNPDSFGLAQMNLALAYLAMPMNQEAERLRYAIAASSLRESLRIFTPEGHPEHWASATVNLANILQHANTTHPEQNLWEAVALYEDVLKLRKPGSDREGYARVLANQGNALAHLGAFSRAVPRLHRARELFAELGDQGAVAMLEEVLDEIAQRQRPPAAEAD